MANKRIKLKKELEKARAKRDEWTAKAEALEEAYVEAEKTEVYGIFEASDLSPEELALVIEKARRGEMQKPEDVMPKPEDGLAEHDGQALTEEVIE